MKGAKGQLTSIRKSSDRGCPVGGIAIEHAVAHLSDAPLHEGNALTLLRRGPEMLEKWLAQIRHARRWVHLENYIFWPGGVGDRFIEALCERARVGVSVRMLVDWFGSSTTPRSFWGELRAAGVEVRMISPPAFGSPLKVAFRDHRKVLSVDGYYASTGGIYIADAWVARSPQMGLPYGTRRWECGGRQ